MFRYLLKILFTILCISLFSCTDKPDDKPYPLFITSDIELFWEVFDNAKPDFKQEDFKNAYVDKGSIGLKDYDKLKDICPKLSNRLNQDKYYKYYNSIRNNTNDLSQVINITKEGFDEFDNIYPGFKPFDVYFLIGSLSAGGKKSSNGLLIAVEFFTKTDTTSIEQLDKWYQEVIRTKEYIPSIVIHELVHSQQNYYPKNGEYFTLLEQSIIEGMADYISLIIFPNQPFMNEYLHLYADTIEKELWDDFELEMNKKVSDTKDWLYNGGDMSRTIPPDLGYYIGYKILESYAEKFDNINDAIVSMLTNSDYYMIFEESHYEDKFQYATTHNSAYR